MGDIKIDFEKLDANGIDYLISIGLTKNNFILYENCLLSHLVNENRLDIIKDLFNFGIDLNEFYFDKLLTCAVEHGHVDIIKYFTHIGIDVNELDGFLTAILYNNLPSLEYFVSLGITLDDISDSSDFLRCASENGSVDVVEYLVKIGITLDDVRSDDYAVIKNAFKDNNYPILQIFYDNFPETHAVMVEIGVDMALLSPLVKSAC